MEFHEQHGLHRQTDLGIGIDHAHRVLVYQLHTRDGNAHLNDLYGRVHRRFDRRERTSGGRHGLRQRKQFQGDFCDHAQRAFAADHETREVVTGGGFARARTRANHFTTGGDHFQAQHVFAHGAVTDCIRAAGAGGAHAANAGVGARVYREKQTGAFDFLVQLFAGHARLDGDRQIFGVDAQHFFHARDIDADAALNR